MHPYQKAAHKQDPKWLTPLKADKASDDAKANDTYRVIANYGSDPKPTCAATYVPKKGK